MPCLDCGAPTRGTTRCARHTKTTTTDRGYGAEHQAARRQWALYVDTGHVECARCGRLITPGTAWHLDHTPDRTGYLGASHAACNDGAR